MGGRGPAYRLVRRVRARFRRFFVRREKGENGSTKDESVRDLLYFTLRSTTSAHI